MGHKQHKKHAKKRSKLPVIAVVLLLIAGSATFYFNREPAAPAPQLDSTGSVITPQPALQESPPKKGTLKQFTAEEFRDLYNNFAWPNTQRIERDQPITGEPAADAQIRTVAEARGYRLRSAPVSNTFVTVEKDMQLQQRAGDAWNALKAAAAKDNILLSLTAGYRAADDQKDIFLGRMSAAGISVGQIATGTQDAKLNQLMSVTAPPSYSRHHSGYTVDIACDNQPGGMFENSTCFEWLSADNYKNAKTHGWIPSYPEGASDQGPKPESWEYVWVGVDAVTD